jgi:ABC-type transporter Mla maintaining outer membrane lipid asymmetry ATPase subunit MlaF
LSIDIMTDNIKASHLPHARIRHPRIASILDECELMLAADCGADLITICGPTGTGKSTLGRFLVEAELRKQATAMSLDSGLVPAIWVEAASSGEDEFSWMLFYQAILTELEGDLDAPRTAYGVDP